jgi:small subunit ribosomal protein S13
MDEKKLKNKSEKTDVPIIESKENKIPFKADSTKLQSKDEGRIVRILSSDIEGKTTIYAGLTKIKGVSWSFANAICKSLNLDKKKKIGALTDKEIEKISEFVKNPTIPLYIYNRRKDFETGEDKHLIGSDLDLSKEFDIKRLKKIKSYRGLRHSVGLPSRGQRTKSHFRTNKKKSVGIKKKAKK